MNQMHAAQTTIDVTGALAAEIVALANRGLTGHDIEQVRRLLLDHFGVAQRGAALPWTRELARWARRFAGTGAAPPPTSCAAMSGCRCNRSTAHRIATAC